MTTRMLHAYAYTVARNNGGLSVSESLAVAHEIVERLASGVKAARQHIGVSDINVHTIVHNVVAAKVASRE